MHPAITEALSEELPGYASTILGRPCWIRNRPGTPKPREECQPFTFTLYPTAELPEYRERYRPVAFTRSEAEKAQEKFRKGLNVKRRKRSQVTAFQALRFPKRQFPYQLAA